MAPCSTACLFSSSDSLCALLAQLLSAHAHLRPTTMLRDRSRAAGGGRGQESRTAMGGNGEGAVNRGEERRRRAAARKRRATRAKAGGRGRIESENEGIEKTCLKERATRSCLRELPSSLLRRHLRNDNFGRRNFGHLFRREKRRRGRGVAEPCRMTETKRDAGGATPADDSTLGR
mmetsp:Transcript_7848/g.16997  ORF Transcript_7848/g.16997 Transcript_7848/m.16997 type:complete len:176 (+) Transcript_7848:219-746(+)